MLERLISGELRIPQSTPSPPAQPKTISQGPPVAPATVSQRTSEAVLGIDSRRYRELVSELRLPHTRQGKLVITRVADWAALVSTTPVLEQQPVSNVERLRQVAGLRSKNG